MCSVSMTTPSTLEPSLPALPLFFTITRRTRSISTYYISFTSAKSKPIPSDRPQKYRPSQPAINPTFLFLLVGLLAEPLLSLERISSGSGDANGAVERDGNAYGNGEERGRMGQTESGRSVGGTKMATSREEGKSLLAAVRPDDSRSIFNAISQLESKLRNDATRRQPSRIVQATGRDARGAARRDAPWQRTCVKPRSALLPPSLSRVVT